MRGALNSGHTLKAGNWYKRSATASIARDMCATRVKTRVRFVMLSLERDAEDFEAGRWGRIEVMRNFQNEDDL